MKLGRAFAGGADVVRTNDSRTPDGRTLDFADIIKGVYMRLFWHLEIRKISQPKARSNKCPRGM